MGWYQANEYCLTHHGTTLASVKNAQEMNLLAPHLRVWHVYQSVHQGWFWIGLKRNSNNEWEWVDGTPFGEYTRWLGGEGSNTNEKCAWYLRDTSYYRGNFWLDKSCNQVAFGFICNDNTTTEYRYVIIYFQYRHLNINVSLYF